jgi:hypothetical protein
MEHMEIMCSEVCFLENKAAGGLNLPFTRLVLMLKMRGALPSLHHTPSRWRTLLIETRRRN